MDTKESKTESVDDQASRSVKEGLFGKAKAQVIYEEREKEKGEKGKKKEKEKEKEERVEPKADAGES